MRRNEPISKRRAALVGLAIAALTAGCGGGAAGHGNPAAKPGTPGQAAIVNTQATDGRLGDAVVARPGHTEVTGHTRKIPARVALPRSSKNAIGAETNCADPDVQPTASNLAHVSDVIFCLM